MYYFSDDLQIYLFNHSPNMIIISRHIYSQWINN